MTVTNNRKHLLLFLLLAILFCFPKNVFAANITICNDGFLYEIDNNYNGQSIEEVEFYRNPLNLFHVYNNESTLEWREATLNGIPFRYNSTGVYNNNGDSKVSSRCYIVQSDNGTVRSYAPKVCGSQFSINDLEFLTSPDNPSNYSEQTVNKSNGTITLIIKPKAGSELAKQWNRLQVSSRTYEGNTSLGNMVKDNEKITISGISPSRLTYNPTYEISFYIDGIQANDFSENVDAATKNSYVESCGGTNGGYYLGILSTAILSEVEAKIANPIKNSNICQEVKNFQQAGEELKKGFINECYDNEVSYYQINNLISSVTQKLEVLRDIYSGNKNVKNLVSEKNLLCTDNRMGIPSEYALAEPFESKVVYEDIGEYFGEVCIENYYVDGGLPSLVRPGEGVDYQNKVEVRKTCSIFQRKTVSRPPQCVSSYSHYCRSLSGPSGSGGWTGGNSGGPNNAFDSCVSQCDGGKYTQKCINQCYQSNYGDTNDRTLLLSKNLIVTSDLTKTLKYDTKKLATDNSVNYAGNVSCGFTSYSGASCAGGYHVSCDANAYNPDATAKGYSKTGRCYLYDANNNKIDEVGYSPWCNQEGHQCTFNISNGPVGCSNDPEAALQAQIAKAKSELQKYESIANEEGTIEEYSWEIVDSKTGTVYKLSGSSKNTNIKSGEPRLIIEKDQTQSKVIRENKTTYQLGEGYTVTGITSKSLNTIYTVDFPITYSRTGDAQVIAIKDNVADQYYSYSENRTDSKDGKNYYRFSSLQDLYNLSFNSSLFSPGRQKYYTNMDSGNYNVSINDSRYTGDILESIPNAKLTIDDQTYIYVLVDLHNNITVNLTVGGVAENQNSVFDNAKFYCYYGVYAAGPKDTESKEECDPEKDANCPEPSCDPKTDINCPGECDPNNPNDPNCPVSDGVCDPNNPNDPNCPVSDGVCDPNNPNDPDCPISDGICDLTLANDPDCDNDGNFDYLGKDPFGSRRGDGGLGLRYYYREIKLTDVFPNDRKPRWNWTGTVLANGETTGAANNDNSAYIVDPQKLIESIESKGESIWTTSDENDYVFTLTPSLITDIRQYNRSRLNGRRITYLDYSLAGNTLKNTYSMKIRDWLPQLDTTSTTECNNSFGKNCDNILRR